MSDPFASYTLPIGLAEGVEIPLPNTPAVFTVILPGTMNEDFNMKLMSGLNVVPDENGQSRINTGLFQRTRRELFFSDCVISARGLPDGMSVEEFFAKYKLAARTLFDRASELATVADEEATAALGKYETTQPGRSSGEESESNTSK